MGRVGDKIKWFWTPGLNGLCLLTPMVGQKGSTGLSHYLLTTENVKEFGLKGVIITGKVSTMTDLEEVFQSVGRHGPHHTEYSLIQKINDLSTSGRHLFRLGKVYVHFQKLFRFYP